MALAAMKRCAAREAAACGGVLSVASIPAHHARTPAKKSGPVPRIYRPMLYERGESERHAMLLLGLLAGARLCAQRPLTWETPHAALGATGDCLMLIR